MWVAAGHEESAGHRLMYSATTRLWHIVHSSRLLNRATSRAELKQVKIVFQNVIVRSSVATPNTTFHPLSSGKQKVIGMVV